MSSASAAPIDRRSVESDIGLTEAHAPRVGMAAFLCSEAAFFATLIIAYLLYLGQSQSGPAPSETLGLGLAAINTALLLASSATLWAAAKAHAWGRTGQMRFGLAATILLGALFLVGTAVEWRELIWEHGLTISTNLFGTTFYTLIGCHAAHVTLGLLSMTVLLGLSLSTRFAPRASGALQLVEWYWHFVDGIWIVLFLVVYVLGR